MNNLDNIKNLSSEIWKNCSQKQSRPSRKDIQQFDDTFEKISIKEFIIYNHINHHGTSLKELLLSTFKFWKNFSYNDWNEIFISLRKEGLAMYYLKNFVNRYLEIDPKKQSAQKVKVNFWTSVNGHVQMVSMTAFVGNLEGKGRQLEEDFLTNNFGLTIQDFVTIRNRLHYEIANLPKKESFWKRLLRIR